MDGWSKGWSKVKSDSTNDVILVKKQQVIYWPGKGCSTGSFFIFSYIFYLHCIISLLGEPLDMRWETKYFALGKNANFQFLNSPNLIFRPKMPNFLGDEISMKIFFLILVITQIAEVSSNIAIWNSKSAQSKEIQTHQFRQKCRRHH